MKTLENKATYLDIQPCFVTCGFILASIQMHSFEETHNPFEAKCVMQSRVWTPIIVWAFGGHWGVYFRISTINISNLHVNEAKLFSALKITLFECNLRSKLLYSNPACKFCDMEISRIAPPEIWSSTEYTANMIRLPYCILFKESWDNIFEEVK